MSKAAELAALIGSQTAQSNRNLVINGAMNVAQRGTSSTSNLYGSVDRLSVQIASLDELAFTQSQIAVTDLAGFNNAFQYKTTTAESAIASDELLYISYKSEAQDCQSFGFGLSSAKSITLSFYVKSSVTGTLSVNSYAADSNRVVASSYTISSANTWERKTITFPGDTTGVINDDNGQGLWFDFMLAVGSAYKGNAATTWEGYATDNWAGDGTFTDAILTTTNATWAITGLQVEAGEVATPFEHRSIADDLALCERYYQIASPLAGSGNSTNFKTTVSFKTAMRAEPTLSFTDNDFDVTDGHASNYASTDANPSWDKYISHSGGVIATANHTSISGDARRGTMVLNAVDDLQMDAEL